jgi:hypothetical protein
MKTMKTARAYHRVMLAPTTVQETILDRTLQICQDEYMRGVRERQVAWTHGHAITQAEQSRDLTARKRDWRNRLRSVYSMVLTDVLYQVRKAFIGKCRDAKSKPPAWFKYPSTAGHSIRDGVLRLSKIGDVSMVPPYPETPAKSVKVEKTADGWFAILAVAVPCEPHNCLICGLPWDAECGCNFCLCGEPIEDGAFCSRDCAVDAAGGCHICGTVGDCVCEE